MNASYHTSGKTRSLKEKKKAEAEQVLGDYDGHVASRTCGAQMLPQHPQVATPSSSMFPTALQAPSAAGN